MVGYRGGNWIWEWSKPGHALAAKTSQEEDATLSGSTGCMRQNLVQHHIPSLKATNWQEQAQALANRAYKEAARVGLAGCVKLSSAIPGGSPVTGFQHKPGEGPFRPVLMCVGLLVTN